MDAVADLVMALRGDTPDRCDWCGVRFSDSQAPNPGEAGQTLCFRCIDDEMAGRPFQARTKEELA